MSACMCGIVCVSSTFTGPVSSAAPKPVSECCWTCAVSECAFYRTAKVGSADFAPIFFVFSLICSLKSWKGDSRQISGKKKGTNEKEKENESNKNKLHYNML